MIDETNMDIVYAYMNLVEFIEEMRREKDMNTTVDTEITTIEDTYDDNTIDYDFIRIMEE